MVHSVNRPLLAYASAFRMEPTFRFRMQMQEVFGLALRSSGLAFSVGMA
jgi:hypothetical protein